MREQTKHAKKHAGHGFSQYELTTEIVKNLSQFDITPTAKLVLIFLTTHYNEEKNGAVVFPSMPYISEKLGIGLTAVKQGIKDLISKGLIIKSKRDKIRGNYNKYLLTQKVQKPASERSENECLKETENDLFMRTNKNEQIKEQTNVAFFKKRHKTVTIEDVPDLIKKNPKVKDPCAYWASLSDDVKAGYTSNKVNKVTEKEAADRYAEHRILKTIEGNRELNSIIPDDPKLCGHLQDVVRALRQK